MKVFLGSPFKGLETVRQALHDALASEHEVFRMEDFGSQEVDALEACLRQIDEVDVYILLFGSSYGTRLPDSDYSFTHLEYERAQRSGTPVLAYVEELAEGVRRDPHSEDFLRQVKSSHLLEYDEFDSAEHLIELVVRDLQRLEKRLLRPKFPTSSPVFDEEAYALGRVKAKVLQGAPFTTTLVDAGAVADPKYRPEKRGRIGDKIETIVRIAKREGALVQIFNDFPVKRKGDVVALKAARANKNALLIVILVPKKTAETVIGLFDAASGDRAVFHGDWFSVADGDYYVETYSDEDLNTCDLRGAVIELIETRVMAHVQRQLA